MNIEERVDKIIKRNGKGVAPLFIWESNVHVEDDVVYRIGYRLKRFEHGRPVYTSTKEYIRLPEFDEGA